MGISFVGLERGMSMAEKKIEDFGEKIGGARKDLYALNRELRYGDILDWNDPLPLPVLSCFYGPSDFP